LREIKEDNRELRQLMSQAKEGFEVWANRPQRPLDAATLKRADDLLSALRDRLALHFSLEESFGYFENAIEAAPRMSDAAAALRAEHGDLFRQIGEVVEKVERLLYHESSAGGFDHLHAAWRSFVAKFERHEEREMELILAVFDEDLGVGD
jgi:hypothetical protein